MIARQMVEVASVVEVVSVTLSVGASGIEESATSRSGAVEVGGMIASVVVTVGAGGSAIRSEEVGAGEPPDMGSGATMIVDETVGS